MVVTILAMAITYSVKAPNPPAPHVVHLVLPGAHVQHACAPTQETLYTIDANGKLGSVLCRPKTRKNS